MHELALSQQVAGIVARAAAGRTVRLVEVEVGALRQVVPTALSSAWAFVVAQTPLATARLQITASPAVLTCPDCGQESRFTTELGFCCRVCGSTEVQVTSGDQFRVLAIEVAD